MISINYRDPRPIYEQIQSELRRLMLTGALPPGSRLPSVRELAGQLAINPNTIQRAYRELEADGYILSVAGKGSFVAQVDQIAEQQKKAGGRCVPGRGTAAARARPDAGAADTASDTGGRCQ